MLKQSERLPLDEPSSVAALDTRVRPHIRILNAAMDEDETSPAGIVLTGRIDVSTLRFLQVDESYQRPLGQRTDIWKALQDGVVVPTIDVGIRGQDFVSDGDDVIVYSPAFIIDGWQRVGTARRILDNTPGAPIRLFGMFHFGTDAPWEMRRFTELNKNVKKVSPNLHLRNMRGENAAVLTLFGLSNNTRDFPLFKRVAWGQAMARGELLPAFLVAKCAVKLHAHQTSVSSPSVEGIAQTLLVAAQNVGLQTFRKNISTFYEIIEECWGIRTIEFRRAAPQIKQTMLFQLARLFSSHVDFWDETERVFFMPADQRRKLSKFPISDPHIRDLAGSGGAAGNILYAHLCDHLNSGKRTGHLRPRETDSRGFIRKAGAAR